MTAPLFMAFGHGFSLRDLILIAGGLFLIWKATKEIHHTVDPEDHKDEIVSHAVNVSLGGAIFQILLLDLVFSVDSIITAVGMTDHLAIMYIAVVVAINQVGIASDLVNILFIGVVAALAIGFGLAFGLGGREVAGQVTQDWYRKSQEAAARVQAASDSSESKPVQRPTPPPAPTQSRPATETSGS